MQPEPCGGCPEVREPLGAAVLWQSRAGEAGLPHVCGAGCEGTSPSPFPVPAATRLPSKVTTTSPRHPLGRAIPKYFPFRQLSLSQGLVLLAWDVFSSVTWLWRGDAGRPRSLRTAPSIPGLRHASALASSTPSPGGGFFLRLLSRKRSRRKALPWSDPIIPPTPNLPQDGHFLPLGFVCCLGCLLEAPRCLFHHLEQAKGLEL